MKYIIFRMHGEEFPVLFAGHISHDTVANALKRHLSLSTAVPVSAGFVSGLVVEHAAKESTSLELKSRPEDAGIINRWARASL